MRHFRLVSVLFLVIFFNSCGEGETADEWFAFDEIAPISEVLYAKDSFRENDDILYIHMSDGAGGSVLKKYEFSQVTSDGKVISSLTQVADFTQLGFTSPNILDLAVSDCGRNPYAIVLDRTLGSTYLVDFINQTKVDLGEFYNVASLRVEGCSNSAQIHALVISGSAYTDTTGSLIISDIVEGDFITYDSANGSIVVEATAFNEIGNFDEIFNGAADIQVIPSNDGNVTENYSAIAVVNGESKLKILQWRPAKDGFVDDTSRFASPILGLNVPIKTFDFKGVDLSASTAHFCAVGVDNKNSNGYKVYMWRPKGTYSTVPAIETDYAGTCSVTNYAKSDAYATYTYPWASYHSAKNELSLVWKPIDTDDIKTMLIDKAKSSNWVFATKVHFISKGEGTSPIMIFYDDNEFLKLAVCKKRQGCTLN